MRRKVTSARLVFVAILLITNVVPHTSQTRLQQLESGQKQLEINIDSLYKENKDVMREVMAVKNESYRVFDLLKSFGEIFELLSALIGGALAGFVVFQVVSGIVQLRREGRQVNLEGNGTQKVNSIMTVIDQTLKSRLTAEKAERKKRQKSEKQLKDVLKDVRALQEVINSLQDDIHNKRYVLEKVASDWASEWYRHDFRGKTDMLDDFVLQYKQLKNDAIRFGVKENGLSTPMLYILGIAAHYANQPEIARDYLKKVVDAQRNISNPDKTLLANAYYYLGLIEFNFGINDKAISSFKEANELDLQHQDFLTRIVTAEAYVMTDEFERAESFLNEVEAGLQKKKRDDLTNAELRLLCRSALIRANMAILRQKELPSKEIKKLLEPLRGVSIQSQYYFAIATLAQAYKASENKNEANELFQEAHKAIENSRDIYKVKEVRSRILLLMTAGICAKFGLQNGHGLANEYLDEADSLRPNLPKIDSHTCTVFSPLTKRNENSDAIGNHIKSIREMQ